MVLITYDYDKKKQSGGCFGLVITTTGFGLVMTTGFGLVITIGRLLWLGDYNSRLLAAVVKLLWLGDYSSHLLAAVVKLFTLPDQVPCHGKLTIHP
jgi:hypothetical protein